MRRLADNRVTLTLLVMLIAITFCQAAEIPSFLIQASGEAEAIFKISDLEIASAKAAINQSDMSLSQRRPFLENLMKSRSRTSQAQIVDDLKVNSNRISAYKTFWITNAIYVRGEVQYLRQLAALDIVESVFENVDLVLVEPVFSIDAEDAATGAEPGLGIIGAREVWNLGLTGEGTLVCNFDTGVDGNHPALASSWRGANGGSAEESWFDPYTNTDFPVDSRGHGTHTMGTIAGRADADTIGVAFGAQWIAAGVVDRGGNISRTVSDILAAFEWAADPDGNPLTGDDVPDVVNNSWGIPAGFYGACDETFWDAIDNLESLGVVCLFAAGNEGPNPSTLRTPADRITTQFNSFAVGAIDGSLMSIARFSSRGPSGCDGQTIKPEITAPGVAIRSSISGGDYAYKSGTSMATPHVAGAVSILRQFNSEATVNEIKAALLQGAVDMGLTGEDNDYGHGLLNIKNSLYHMPPPGHPFLNLISVGIDDDQNGIAEPGETVSLRIRLENLGASGIFESFLSAESPELQILDDYAEIGMIDYRDTLAVDAFSLSIPEFFHNGDSAVLQIELISGDWHQRFTYTLRIGGDNEISVATITTDIIEMSFSNIGQFGLGENSINPAGGRGFRYPVGNVDFMREASLMISSSGRVIDGARNSSNVPDNDFKPLPGGAARVTAPGLYSDYDGYAAYSDSAAEAPIGLAVTQNCYGWDLNAKFVITEFIIENISSESITDLRVGLYCDWNLALSSGIDDAVYYDDVRSLGYIEDNPSGWCAGIRTITDYPSSYRAIDNDLVFADGFSDSEKLQFMNAGFDIVSYPDPGDYSHLLTMGPYSLDPGMTEVFAFAFVVGESLNEIEVQADLAFDMYPQLTDFSVSDEADLPNSVEVFQNFPNPFNGTTTIKLLTEKPAELVIYDVLGKIIKNYNIAETGMNEIIWDGKNDNGESVVSGIYFYRVRGAANSESKKMLYIK